MGIRRWLGSLARPAAPRPEVTLPHRWTFGGVRQKIPVMVCERGCPVVWWPWEHEDWKGDCVGTVGDDDRPVSDGTTAGLPVGASTSVQAPRVIEAPE